MMTFFLIVLALYLIGIPVCYRMTRRGMGADWLRAGLLSLIWPWVLCVLLWVSWRDPL
jgi:hypothetical protein